MEGSYTRFLAGAQVSLASCLAFSSSKAASTLKGQCHEIFDFRFFHVVVSLKPLSIPLSKFEFF
jgi:hypothetical protein